MLPRGEQSYAKNNTNLADSSDVKHFSRVCAMEKMMRNTVFAVIAFTLAIGCTDDDAGGQESTRPEITQEESGASDLEGPKISFSADKTHAVQPGDDVTLTVTVSDFTLDADKLNQANESGVGHFRVYLDDATGDDYLAVSGNPKTIVKIPDDITDGSHEVRVALHNNDQSPLDPPVEAKVWIIVYRL